MATRKEKKKADPANQAAEISAMSLTNAQKSGVDLKIAASEISRRSYTSPNEVEIYMDRDDDLERNAGHRPRQGSVDGASERGELMSASFFDEEEGNYEVGRQKWEDFMALQKNEKRQPELHEQSKTICMKMFPKLAQRTNLSPEELKTYYAVRFTYIIPYNEKVRAQEMNLLSLAMALLRAGKVRFELHPEGQVDDVAGIEESKSQAISAH